MSSTKRVEVIEKTTPHQGFLRVDRYRLRHERHAGGWTPVLQREVMERGHSAAVLPYDPQRDEVVLIEQFRPGAYAAGLAPWVLEAVAGVIEDGESAEAVVRREIREEAGCGLQEMECLGSFILSPGGSSEILTIYCGHVDAAGLGGVHGLEDEGEDIAVVVCSAAAAFDMVERGEIHAANAVIPLQWLRLNRESLRARWR